MQEDGAMKRSLLMVSIIITIIVMNKTYALIIAPANKPIEVETQTVETKAKELKTEVKTYYNVCLLYTSDAADE